MLGAIPSHSLGCKDQLQQHRALILDLYPIPSLSMPFTRQITVALYYRDGYSTGRNRKFLGYEAFHWGIVIMPEDSQDRDCDEYDATDRNEINPTTFRMENPNMDWWLNTRQGVDPSRDGKLLGRIIIGAIPHEKSSRDVKTLLEQIPLPKKNQSPQQSCVTWVEDAILTFQEKAWADNFAVGKFMKWAFSYADGRLSYPQDIAEVVYYIEVLNGKEEMEEK